MPGMTTARTDAQLRIRFQKFHRTSRAVSHPSDKSNFPKPQILLLSARKQRLSTSENTVSGIISVKSKLKKKKKSKRSLICKHGYIKAPRLTGSVPFPTSPVPVPGRVPEETDP